MKKPTIQKLLYIPTELYDPLLILAAKTSKGNLNACIVNCIKMALGDKTENANTVLYDGILKKYIAHIVYHEGISYISDSRINDSDVKFTEEEIKLLRDIATSVYLS